MESKYKVGDFVVGINKDYCNYNKVHKIDLIDEKMIKLDNRKWYSYQDLKLFQKEEYICVIENKFGEERYSINEEPKFNIQYNYKLINKKHEDILRAYLDGKAIEYDCINSGWTYSDFICDYREDGYYRIKETKSDNGVMDIDIDEEPKQNKNTRKIVGHKGGIAYVDVYDVLTAFKVKNPALQHLIKKALYVGIKGHKDSSTYLQDIIDSAVRAKELER